MSELISIITPSYNSIDTIEETYGSIQAQSHSNWEWLITDDCSSDGTYDFLKNLSLKDSRIRVFQNSINSGAAISRNNSLKEVRGEFVAFIDSDDLWRKDKLFIQLNYMTSQNIDFSFTAYELIDEHSGILEKYVDTQQVKPLSYEDMLRKKATLGCSTVMLRKSAFGDIQMPLLRTGQDYGLWLQLLKRETQAYPIQTILTQYRILPDSISRNKFKKAKRQWQIYREIEKLGLFKTVECFCFYAWRAIFRK